MRRSVLTSCMALFLPLSGCGSIQLTGDAQDGGKCTPLNDQDSGPQKVLADYYKQVRDDTGIGNDIFKPGSGLEAFAGTNFQAAADNAFTGPPSWKTDGPDPTASLTPGVVSDVKRSFGVTDPTVDIPRPTQSAATAAEVLWTHIAAVMPQATAAENAMSARTAGTPAGSPAAPQQLAKLGARDHWETEVAQAVQAGGDDALAYLTTTKTAQAAAQLKKVKTIEAAKTYVQRQQESYVGQFVRAYFKAYFRAGHLFQGQLQTSDMATNLVDAVVAKLGAAKLSTSDEATLVSDVQTKLQGLCKSTSGTDCLFTSPIGPTQFVSRSGSTYGFQGVTLTVGYTNGVQATWDFPRASDYGPKMVRVLIEAVFDAKRPFVPAVATSTACDTTFNLPYTVVDGQPLNPSKYCLTSALTGSVSLLQDAVSAVDEKAARADSLTGVATGIVVRSFGVAALNNEAAAGTIESLTAVIARKVTERAAWRQTITNACVPASTSATPPANLQVSK